MTKDLTVGNPGTVRDDRGLTSIIYTSLGVHGVAWPIGWGLGTVLSVTFVLTVL